MPKLQDLRQTKIISLPSYPGSQVEIYDSLLIGDMKKFNLDSGNPMERILQSLPLYIKSWNFQNEDESPMEITLPNLDFLKQEDGDYLINEIINFKEEVKKKPLT